MNECPHCKRPMNEKISAIIRRVAAKHGVTYAEIIGMRRASNLVTARLEAYYRCKTETNLSYGTIAAVFGGRDHSSIMSGAKSYEKRGGLPPFRRKTWNAALDAKLEELLDKGVPYKEIAMQIGKSYRGCQDRAYVLGLTKWSRVGMRGKKAA